MTIANKLSEKFEAMRHSGAHDAHPTAQVFAKLAADGGAEDGGIAYFQMLLAYLQEIEEQISISTILKDHQRTAFLTQFKHAKNAFRIENLAAPWGNFKAMLDLGRVIDAMKMIDFFLETAGYSKITSEQIDAIGRELDSLEGLINELDVHPDAMRILRIDIDRLRKSIEIIDTIGDAEFMKRYKSLAADFTSIADVILANGNAEHVSNFKSFVFRARGWLGVTADVMQVTGVSGPAPLLLARIAGAV
jgi:hypothetical protein